MTLWVKMVRFSALALFRIACVAGGISRVRAFVFGSEAVSESGEAVRGLVKSPVEFPPAQIRGVF